MGIKYPSLGIIYDIMVTYHRLLVFFSNNLKIYRSKYSDELDYRYGREKYQSR